MCVCAVLLRDTVWKYLKKTGCGNTTNCNISRVWLKPQTWCIHVVYLRGGGNDLFLIFYFTQNKTTQSKKRVIQ